MSNKHEPIFTFEVSRKVEKAVSEKTTDESGAEITKTTKQLVDEPVKVVIKRPSRRQEDEANEEYTVSISRFLKRGVYTKAMLANQYANAGGLMSEPDAKEYQESMKKLIDLNNEFQTHGAFSKKGKKADEKQDQLTTEISVAQKKLVDLETRYQSLFEHTAEAQAEAKMMLWYGLHLVHIEEGDELKPLYPGETFEDKENSYYEKEEDPDEVYLQIQKKIYLILAVWFYNKKITPEQLGEALKNLGNV